MSDARDDLRRLIARLALAVMAADGNITSAEFDGLGRFDVLGLGPLEDVVREEIERAVRRPIDVAEICSTLPPLSHHAADLLLSALADLAASDRLLSPREREMFHLVAGHLGVDAASAARVLERAFTVPAPPNPVPPEPAREGRDGGAGGVRGALAILGLEPGVGRGRIDEAFLDRVQRYDPAKVGELGPEFAALAIRRLAVVADAYEVAIAGIG
jgi:uncharacterized tellurite resistance protein B-like protein